MSAQHTPGVWQYDSSSECIYGTSVEGEHIVVVYETNTDEADISLITAAPALLAALQVLVDRNFTFFDGGMVGADRKITRDEVLAARAAISKATGATS